MVQLLGGGSQRLKREEMNGLFHSRTTRILARIPRNQGADKRKVSCRETQSFSLSFNVVCSIYTIILQTFSLVFAEAKDHCLPKDRCVASCWRVGNSSGGLGSAWASWLSPSGRGAQSPHVLGCVAGARQCVRRQKIIRQVRKRSPLSEPLGSSFIYASHEWTDPVRK